MFVFLIVVAHLLFFVIRNPFDLWHKEMTTWLKDRGYWAKWSKPIQKIDYGTYYFANFVGCEQRWVMFSPPMAKGANFLGFRLEFDDGSQELVTSPNEPTPARFFRFGGWRMRKYEDTLMWPDEDLAKSPEYPFWQAYIRRIAQQWRLDHPEDARKLERIVLLRRRIIFTTPEETPGTYNPPSQVDVATFDPEGKVIP
jgi:hypothetical protein